MPGNANVTTGAEQHGAGPLQARLDAPTDFVELLPVAAYACDLFGRILWFNRRAADLWGRRPRTGDDSERFCGSYALYIGGREISREESPMALALRSGEAIHNAEVIVERPDGTRIWANLHIDPIKDAVGSVLGAINCLHDITKLHQAREAAAEGEARTLRLLEALPAAVYATDEAGRITYYNQAAVELAGREPTLGSDEWCVTWKLYRPDGTRLPHDQCPMALALKERRPNRGTEAIAERPDGSRTPILPYPTPLFDASGKLTGAVNVLVDITQRRRTEETLREREERLSSIFAQSTAGFAETDLSGRFTMVNDRYCAITGRSREELLKLRMHDITHADDLAKSAPFFDRAVQEGRSFDIEKRYQRPDGSSVWVSNSVFAVKGPEGRVESMIAVCIEITERKLHEERQHLLLNELNHRVKNTLATVQSIAVQTLRNSHDTEQAREQFSARLIALSRAHDILTRENWEGAFLNRIVDEAITAYRVPQRDRFEIDGPRVWLSAKHALALSMGLHELCTNAVKYGALSNDQGRVRIEWSVAGLNGAPELRMRWTELRGPPVEGAMRGGFGSRLIEQGLRQDLSGEAKIDFASTGVICTITAPLKQTGGPSEEFIR